MADELRPDIAAAKEKMHNKFGAGREIRTLVEHLWEGETVERMTADTYGTGQGLVVLTDRRLLFTKDGVMSQKTEDFPLSKVSSVQWSVDRLFWRNVNSACISRTELARSVSMPTTPPRSLIATNVYTTSWTIRTQFGPISQTAHSECFDLHKQAPRAFIRNALLRTWSPVHP